MACEPERLLTRQQVQRTLARVRQATALLWSENPKKRSPIRRVIDQLTELGDDLLHEIEEHDEVLRIEGRPIR
jgi:hypothetical protein